MSRAIGPYQVLEVAKTGSLEDLLKLLESSTLSTRDPPQPELSPTKPSEGAAASTELCESNTSTSGALNTNRQIYPLVDVTNSSGETALWFAAAYVSDVAIQTLIGAGADVNKRCTYSRQTPLMMVTNAHFGDNDVKERCVQHLLKAGADMNAQDTSGCTALMSAAGRGAVNCVKILLKAGAYAGVVNNEGKTALMVALSHGTFSCAEVLVKAPNQEINGACDRGKTALIYAVECFREHCIERPLRFGAHHFDTSAPSVVFDCVKLLLKAGADVNICDKDGKTAVMYASIKDTMVDLLRVLLQADGVDVNLLSRCGMTAVMHAVSSGSPECLQCLVNSGASVHTAGYLNKTPLHYFMAGHEDPLLAEQCLKILLDAGANVNAADDGGMTPLMNVAGRSLTPAALHLLINHRANVNLVDSKGRSALIHSLNPSNFTSSLKNAECLLQNGADPNVNPLQGKSALACAIHIKDLGLLRVLVEHGVEMRVDREMFQEIHLVHVNKLEVLQFLIMNGMMPSRGIASRPTSENTKSFPSALIIGPKTPVIKYFIVNCYLHNDDIRCIHYLSSFQDDFIGHARLKPLMVALGRQPWPLVKLCFVTVSTLLGASPGRHERIQNSRLPRRLQDMLMFNDPFLKLSRLCPHYWNKIPLTLNPEEYERQPLPRPLLYNWPVGRPVVKCDCGRCGGTMFKFDVDDEDSDTSDDEASDSDSDF